MIPYYELCIYQCISLTFIFVFLTYLGTLCSISSGLLALVFQGTVKAMSSEATLVEVLIFIIICYMLTLGDHL